MKKYALLVLLILTTIGKTFSQADTVVIVKTDTVFIPEKKDIMYKMYVENKEPEIKHLWKLNLVDLGAGRLNIGFEQQLAKTLTVEEYTSYRFKQLPDLFDLDYADTYLYASSFKLEQMLKWYFDNKYRERKNLKTNALSGQYFAMSILFNRNHYENTTIGNETNLNFGLKYGIQKRIESLVYIELYVGCYYNLKWSNYEVQLQPKYSSSYYSHSFLPFVGFRAGFAISSFKSIKNVLNK
jgi:hypothetical protein